MEQKHLEGGMGKKLPSAEKNNLSFATFKKSDRWEPTSSLFVFICLKKKTWDNLLLLFAHEKQRHRFIERVIHRMVFCTPCRFIERLID